MIKAVIFDIDNTMYDYDACNEIAIQTLKEYCMSAFSICEETFYETFTKAQETIKRRTGSDCAANHNRLIRFQCMLDFLHVPFSSYALKMYHVYWDTLIDVMKPEPGLMDLIKTLQKKQISIGIGSDMTAYIQYKKLEKLGVLDAVSQMTTSEETGVEKPAAHFFEVCTEKMKCRPEEIVFIGDSLRKDVQGACQYGMHGVWYHPKGQSDYPCIGSYEECVKHGNIYFGENLIIE